MKRQFRFIVTFLLLISGLINGLNGQNVKEIFYENGTLKEKGLQNKAGSRTGGWKFYYENESLLQVGTVLR